MKKESEKLFREYGEKFQNAIKEENYLKAFQIILTGIEVANERKDRGAIEAISGLVRALGIMVSIKYGMSRTDDMVEYIDSCYMCDNHFKKEELLFGYKGAICKGCANLAHHTFLDNPKEIK